MGKKKGDFFLFLLLNVTMIGNLEKSLDVQEWIELRAVAF